MTRLAVSFLYAPIPSIEQVGGKGWSLMRMTTAGLAIPPGFTLTVAFFEPWMHALRQTEAWAEFLAADAEDLAPCCDALKEAASGLQLDPPQRAALDSALADLGLDDVFAVRSSSPEEDLEGSSFAGAYETVLGVRRDRIVRAIRTAFSSCLDARITVYKREHGLDWRTPQIAVVVQRQIASEVAGVGFSVDPISNDHDHATFSANWGLGETVVAGTASPDLFVVDKTTRTIIDRTLGHKETSMWLDDHGTSMRAAEREGFCLTDAQVEQLTAQILLIEQLYDRPMDIEWAFDHQGLWLLQARPITTYIPVSDAMVTEPGARRRLYLDLTVAVQGMPKPLSVMGTSMLQHTASCTSKMVFGHDTTRDIDSTVPFVDGGRIWLNMSNLFAVAGQDKVAGFFEMMDPLAAAALAAADNHAYVAPSFDRAQLVPGVLTQLPTTLSSVIESRLMPARMRRDIEQRVVTWRAEVHALANADGPILTAVDTTLTRTAALVLHDLIPALIMARRSVGQLRSYFPDDPRCDALDQALPGNLTVELGFALESLAATLQGEWTAQTLGEAIDAGRLPDEFMEQWRAFIGTYGHRGTLELDIANDRYHEDPSLLVQQLVDLANMPPSDRPSATHGVRLLAREAAFDELHQVVRADRGWFSAKRFTSLYRVVEHLGGLRETHKSCVIEAFDLLRRRVLERGDELVAQGRIDAGMLWDLTLEDLTFDGDLRAMAASNRAFSERLRRVPRLPSVMDSRGRVLRPPPRPATDGELVGQPISAGVVTGPVKVLHDPREKPLLPGDILVARATDPSWTPLFANAAAIVLEVGGVLQHGALVAREYGKPCVAGIERVTERLNDGDWVQVDGAAGVVRIVEPGGQDVIR